MRASAGSWRTGSCTCCGSGWDRGSNCRPWRTRGNWETCWPPPSTRLEQERLFALARDWLEEERRRTPFEVLACELEQEIGVEGVAVQTRIDRIDRLPDGSEVIIDYKTGKAGVKDWLGERPDDPQLPLYAASREGKVAAIGFAVLRRGREFGYRGLARDEGILPATPAFTATHPARQPAGGAPAWDDLLAGWRETLAGLARGFRDGDARVAPKTAQTCRYCEQHALCRIYEQAAGGITVGGDDEDG
jgi:ATP-dependent helicase/nuclease subunit B